MEVLRSLEVAKYTPGDTRLIPEDPTLHLSLIHTGCNRRNGPDFGRVFLMLNYNEKPQNTYIQN